VLNLLCERHRYTYYNSAITRLIEWLLQAGADPDIASTKGTLPVHSIAKEWGESDLLKLLITTSNINCRDEDGYTPLHLVCKQNDKVKDMDAIEWLLQAGADPNIPSCYGDMPIHAVTKTAAFRRFGAITALATKFNINSQNGQGDTPLHLLCISNPEDLTAVEWLLDEGADPNIRSNSGDLPLHYAAAVGNMPLCAMLIKHTPHHVNAQNGSAITPLMRACYCSKQCISVVRYLLEKAADIAVISIEKCQALHYAVIRGHVDIVELLLQNGAAVNQPGPQGMTALNIACCKPHGNLFISSTPNRDLVKMLLKYGGDIETRSEYGISPKTHATPPIDVLIEAWDLLSESPKHLMNSKTNK
jgi:ankyrin repeat protein